MEQGWVYILVNSSIPGLVKVGRTTRPPAARAAALSAATGVATPFVLAFEQAFADCVEAERLVHAELDRRELRVAPNREFFRGSPALIVRVVLDVAAAGGSPPMAGCAQSALHLLAEGERHMLGTGAHFQDLAEATHCYKLAAARGSLVALERLGAIYARADDKRRAERRRAMRYLKDGAKRGNYYCYTEMAWLFAQDGHVANFTKAWELFFANRASFVLEEVEAGANRYARALFLYIAMCLHMRLEPGHMAELQAAAPALLGICAHAADTAGTALHDRRLAAAARHWVRRHVAPDPAPDGGRPSWLQWLGIGGDRPRPMAV